MLVQFIAMMILARLLTPNDFGQIGVLSIFLMVANVLNDAGFGGSLIKEKTITAIDKSTVFVYNSTVSLTIYILLFIFSNSIESFFNSPGLANVTKSVSIVFVINSFGMVSKAILTRDLRFKVITISNMTGVICASIAGICMAYVGFGVYSLVAYQIVQAIVVTVIVVFFAKFKICFRFSIRSFKHLFSFGFFTTCCNVVDTIYENSLSFLFGKFLNISQAGYISQAKRMEEVSTTSVAQTINTASFPILTRIPNRKDFINETHSLLKMVPSILFPILMVIPLFSKELVILVLGEKWGEAGPYLAILTYAGIFMILETLTRNFIKSLGAVSSLLKATLIKRLLGLGIIISALAIYKPSVLWAYVIGSAIGLIFNLQLFAKLTKQKLSTLLVHITKYSLPSILFLLVSYCLFGITESIVPKIVIAVVLLILTYFSTLKILGIKISQVRHLIK